MKTNKIDAKCAELLERVDQLPQTPSKAVIPIYQYRIYLPPAARGQHPVQLWALFPRSAYAHIHVLALNLPAAPYAELTEFSELHLRFCPAYVLTRA